VSVTGLGKEPGSAQQHLVRELVHLRSVAGLDQREIAKALDLSQATVSRVERLGKLLSLPEVRAWAQVCGASAEVVGRLTALTDAAWTQMQPMRDLQTDSRQPQDEVRANEATARTLRYYSPTVIPGLLQTPGYAEHVLRRTNYTGQGDEAAALAGRWLELVHTYVTASHPADVALYHEVFDKLRTASITGPDVVAMMQCVASELRVQS
jgi:transcriptional regulator with XRE-family HTH domain